MSHKVESNSEAALPLPVVEENKVNGLHIAQLALAILFGASVAGTLVFQSHTVAYNISNAAFIGSLASLAVNTVLICIHEKKIQENNSALSQSLQGISENTLPPQKSIRRIVPNLVTSEEVKKRKEEFIYAGLIASIAQKLNPLVKNPLPDKDFENLTLEQSLECFNGVIKKVKAKGVELNSHSENRLEVKLLNLLTLIEEETPFNFSTFSTLLNSAFNTQEYKAFKEQEKHSTNKEEVRKDHPYAVMLEGIGEAFYTHCHLVSFCSSVLKNTLSEGNLAETLQHDRKLFKSEEASPFPIPLKTLSFQSKQGKHVDYIYVPDKEVGVFKLPSATEVKGPNFPQPTEMLFSRDPQLIPLFASALDLEQSLSSCQTHYLVNSLSNAPSTSTLLYYIHLIKLGKEKDPDHLLQFRALCQQCFLYETDDEQFNLLMKAITHLENLPEAQKATLRDKKAQPIRLPTSAMQSFKKLPCEAQTQEEYFHLIKNQKPESYFLPFFVGDFFEGADSQDLLRQVDKDLLRQGYQLQGELFTVSELKKRLINELQLDETKADEILAIRNAHPWKFAEELAKNPFFDDKLDAIRGIYKEELKKVMLQHFTAMMHDSTKARNLLLLGTQGTLFEVSKFLFHPYKNDKYGLYLVDDPSVISIYNYTRDKKLIITQHFAIKNANLEILYTIETRTQIDLVSGSATIDIEVPKKKVDETNA